MTFLLICSILLSSTERTRPDYPRDLSTWKAVPIPPVSMRGDRAVWDYAANYSKHEWQVFVQNGRPSARLQIDPGDLPSFLKKGRGIVCQKVEDGWLVATNRGEWGGSLDWFSPNGARKVHVSNHQVRAFFRRADGLYAAEGLAHLGFSGGSIVRLARSKPAGLWTATKVHTLPAAPCAASLRRDGTAVIVLTDRVVAFDRDRRMRTLFEAEHERSLPDAKPESPLYSQRYSVWSGLYPNSSVLSASEVKLYVGMRQYVGEVDLVKRTHRFLVPSDSFLNRLSKDEERSIRATYRGS